jgi:hypothetical protein
MTRIDIPDIRRRCAGAIQNTPAGKWLGLALDELETLRERHEPEHMPLFDQAEPHTPTQLRQQANRCEHRAAAAILLCVAGWLEGREMPRGSLEPWEFADLWARREEEE